MLRPGHKIWCANKVDDLPLHYTGPYTILSLRKILPRGKTEDGRPRKRSLVQVYTDPGGVRTLAVSDIWSRDPGKASEPW